MKLQREPAWDGLRATAALLVLAFHTEAPFIQGGFNGVAVFFVLSGYLITTLLRQELDARGAIDLGGFFLRRAVRLYPALLFMLAGFLAFSAIWPGREWEALVSALYVSDIARVLGLTPVVLTHTWSLAVEAQFYFVWPLILPRLRRPIPMLAVAYLAFTALRILGGWSAGYGLQCSGLVLGALATYLPKAPGRWASVALVAILACATLFRFPTTEGLSLGVTCTEIATAVLVGALTQESAASRLLGSRPFVWLGSVSYAIYLWHYPIIYVLKRVYPWPVTWALAVPMSILMAWISWGTVERPAITLTLGWSGRRRGRETVIVGSSGAAKTPQEP